LRDRPRRYLLVSVGTIFRTDKTIRGLEWTVEAERRALEVERKQVEGEPLFDSCVVAFSLRVRTLFLTSFSSGNFRLAHRAWARG
jgi:hypothetical protein